MRNNKSNKQNKQRKNAELSKTGRTSRQIKLKKMKEAISNYLIHHPKYKFPPTFNIDLKYSHMHKMTADKNRKLREKARRLQEEADAEDRAVDQQLDTIRGK